MRLIKATALAVVSGAVLATAPLSAAHATPDVSAATSAASAAGEDGRGAAPIWPEQPRISGDGTEQADPAALTINMDFSQAPDLEPVANNARAVLEEWYPKASEMLPTEGYTPPQEFDVIFDPNYDGVAGVSGTTMTVGAKYMREHPDDLGLFVHEGVHIIQQYGANDVPGWLTEGIADYIRYYHYQADNNPIPGEERTHYTDGYGQAAFLLNHVRTTYADDFVAFINDAARRNVYTPQLWVDKTGKDTEALWAEAVAAG